MENVVMEWTITGHRGEAWFPKQRFDTKAQAVLAMDAQRQPKTPIIRVGHDYVFTPKE
jgi:hypothetical protein